MQGSQTPFTRFIQGYNGTASNSVVGEVVSLSQTAADGMTVIQPVTANLNLRLGVWANIVAPSAWGPVQVEGFRDDVQVEGTTDIAVGDLLEPTDQVDYMTKDAAFGRATLAIALEAYTDASQAGKKAWIIG